MRWTMVLPPFFLLFSACASQASLHPGMHPSIVGDSSSAGINTGILYGIQDAWGNVDNHFMLVPYGEGFVRFAAGSGQVELRLTPGMGHVAYRANLMSAEERAVGFALIPAVGMGFFGTLEVEGTHSSGWAEAVVAPNVAILLSFADGSLYVAPRFGYAHLVHVQDGSYSTGRLVLAANLGYVFEGDPWDIALELGLQRSTSTEYSEDGDRGASLLIYPSVGILF